MIYDLLVYAINDMTPEQFDTFITEFRELVASIRGVSGNLYETNNRLRDINMTLDQLPNKMPSYAVPYEINRGFHD